MTSYTKIFFATAVVTGCGIGFATWAASRDWPSAIRCLVVLSCSISAVLAAMKFERTLYETTYDRLD